MTAIPRFFYRSRKTLILIVATVLMTLIFSYVIQLWSSNNNYAPNNETDRKISTSGTLYIRDLEIFGGDLIVEGDRVYVDWGELALGASKNATFYAENIRNDDVKLGLNVTNWFPIGIDNYISISWDYNGTLLVPAHPMLVTINLQVTSDGDFIDFLVENNINSFGFDMTIYASEL